MRGSRLFMVLGAGALSLALIAGFSAGCVEPSVGCEKLCNDLWDCALLPSALGSDPASGSKDYDSCVARCSNSQPHTQDAFAKCHREVCDADGTFEDRWCCDDGCRQLSECLEELAGEVLNPSGTVVVQFSGGERLVTIPPPSVGCAPECSASTRPDSPVDAAFCSGSAPVGILGVHLTPVTGFRAFLETDQGVRHAPETACDIALEQGVTFTGVPAGPVRAGVRLELSAGESSSCHVLWSHRVVVLPGREATATIPLPRPDRLACAQESQGAMDCTGEMPVGACVRYTCEEGAEACADGSDNDGNGRVDCQEEVCKDLPVCQTSP